MRRTQERQVSVLEGPFCRALEIALNAPHRLTRVSRINSGVAVIGSGEDRRVFRGAAAGTGDLVGYAAPEGLHLEVETKRAGERPNPAQKRRRAALERAGAVYVVVWGPWTEEGLDEAVAAGVAAVDAAIETRRARRC